MSKYYQATLPFPDKRRQLKNHLRFVMGETAYDEHHVTESVDSFDYQNMEILLEHLNFVGAISTNEYHKALNLFYESN